MEKNQYFSDDYGIRFFGGDKEHGNVFVVESKIPAGKCLESHTHTHPHVSVLVSGNARVCVGAEIHILEGYNIVTIPADVVHSVEALTDVIWLCLWDGELAPRKAAEESLRLNSMLRR